MDPNFWGPYFWTSIHSATVTYTPDKAQAFKAFLYSLTEILPCMECREHLKQNLTTFKVDPYLTDNHSLFLWSYYLHDIVNQQLGKKSPPLQAVKNLYFNPSRCKSCSIKK